jgi:hypothetical protein
MRGEEADFFKEKLCGLAKQIKEMPGPNGADATTALLHPNARKGNDALV